MSHDIYEVNNKYSIAYAGDTPWHGLGQRINHDDPIEVWMEEAQLEWEAVKQPLFRRSLVSRLIDKLYGREFDNVDGKVAIARSDTNEVLSIVSDKYQPVQPYEVLEFYRELTEVNGFRMETAGSLQRGRRVWALADTGREFSVDGIDRVKFYLLLATSYDGTFATTAQFTSVRVVCNNTLGISLDCGKGPAVKVRHNSLFNADDIKLDLGLKDNTFDKFIEDSIDMADTKIGTEEAIAFFLDVFKRLDENPNLERDRIMNRVLQVYDVTQKQMPDTCDGTVWGVINAVTNYVDFVRGRSPDSRLNYAWFGQGNTIKAAAWNKALKIIWRAAA